MAPLLLVTVAAFSVLSCRPEEGRVVSYSDSKSFFKYYLLFVCFAKKLGLVTREEGVIGGWGLGVDFRGRRGSWSKQGDGRNSVYTIDFWRYSSRPRMSGERDPWE